MRPTANFPRRNPFGTVEPPLQPGECDPAVPQGTTSGGLVAAYVDGSVRTLRAGMSEAAFWGAVTPASGEVADDW